jgi:hypothetical protein
MEADILIVAARFVGWGTVQFFAIVWAKGERHVVDVSTYFPHELLDIPRLCLEEVEHTWKS